MFSWCHDCCVNLVVDWLSAWRAWSKSNLHGHLSKFWLLLHGKRVGVATHVVMTRLEMRCFLAPRFYIWVHDSWENANDDRKREANKDKAIKSIWNGITAIRKTWIPFKWSRMIVEVHNYRAGEVYDSLPTVKYPKQSMLRLIGCFIILFPRFFTSTLSFFLCLSFGYHHPVVLIFHHNCASMIEFEGKKTSLYAW